MRLSFGRYVLAGLVAAIVAVVFTNLYTALFSLTTGLRFPELSYGSVTAAALLMPLLGAIFFYLMARLTESAAAIFITVGLAVLLLSFVAAMMSSSAPGFVAASFPLHIIVAISSLTITPIMIRPREQATADPTLQHRPTPPHIPYDSEIPRQAPSTVHYPPETGIPD